MSEQLIDLESRLAFQEQSIQQLSDQVAAQQLQIDRLERLNRAIAQRMRELGDATPGAAVADEMPPHY